MVGIMSILNITHIFCAYESIFLSMGASDLIFIICLFLLAGMILGYLWPRSSDTSILDKLERIQERKEGR
jgi:hypothetical protein